MKPVFLKASQIDKIRWDRTVEQSGTGNFYALSWYLDTVCPEWNALILGDYDYIMPLPTKRKGFFKILYQPFFSRQHGILGRNQPDFLTLAVFLNALPKSYKQVMFGTQQIESVEIEGYSISNYQYQELELGRDLNEIKAGYSENASRILKKLEKSHIRYKEIKPEEVVKLFASETAGKMDYIRPKDLKTLQNIMQRCLKLKMGLSFGAFDENQQLLAAGFFVQFQNRICYLKGSSNEAGKKNGAMYGIMNEVISTFHTTFDVLDFGGSRIPSIAGFFKKFGAIDHYYSFVQKNPSFLINLGKRLYHKLSR